MIRMDNRGSSYLTFSKLILIVNLLRRLLFKDGGYSSVHSHQPLVQLTHLAEAEHYSPLLPLTLQTVTDTLLAQRKASFTFNCSCTRTVL